jgi:hypothetical protein
MDQFGGRKIKRGKAAKASVIDEKGIYNRKGRLKC